MTALLSWRCRSCPRTGQDRPGLRSWWLHWIATHAPAVAVAGSTAADVRLAAEWLVLTVHRRNPDLDEDTLAALTGLPPHVVFRLLRVRDLGELTRRLRVLDALTIEGAA